MMGISQTTNQRTGLSFLSILALIFITLKLTAFINWSWWWVLAPLWVPIALLIVIFAVTFIVMILKN